MYRSLKVAGTRRLRKAARLLGASAAIWLGSSVVLGLLFARGTLIGWFRMGIVISTFSLATLVVFWAVQSPPTGVNRIEIFRRLGLVFGGATALVYPLSLAYLSAVAGSSRIRIGPLSALDLLLIFGLSLSTLAGASFVIAAKRRGNPLSQTSAPS